MPTVLTVTLVVVLAAVAIIAVVVLARRARETGRAALPARRRRLPDAPEPQIRGDADRITVTLPIGDVDPDLPQVERLVRQAAERVLHEHAAVQRVEVRSSSGRLLGEVLRPDAPTHRDVALPEQLSEPTSQRSHAPAPVRRPRPSHPTRSDDTTAEVEQTRRTLADRFDLPAPVAAALPDDADLVNLLAALLEASGHQVRIDDDVVLTGDTAVVALRGSGPDAMNHAYRRYDASGALQGLAISLGYLSPREVERRELLAPDLRYVGPDAIQRMADAVALGADPLAFAVGTPLLG